VFWVGVYMGIIIGFILGIFVISVCVIAKEKKIPQLRDRASNPKGRLPPGFPAFLFKEVANNDRRQSWTQELLKRERELII
jgi:hypothetical protein